MKSDSVKKLAVEHKANRQTGIPGSAKKNAKRRQTAKGPVLPKNSKGYSSRESIFQHAINLTGSQYGPAYKAGLFNSLPPHYILFTLYCCLSYSGFVPASPRPHLFIAFITHVSRKYSVNVPFL